MVGIPGSRKPIHSVMELPEMIVSVRAIAGVIFQYSCPVGDVYAGAIAA
jgi:hypothetical protein